MGIKNTMGEAMQELYSPLASSSPLICEGDSEKAPTHSSRGLNSLTLWVILVSKYSRNQKMFSHVPLNQAVTFLVMPYNNVQLVNA